jgi:hypothetical protein
MPSSYLDLDFFRQTDRVHFVGVKNGIASLNISLTLPSPISSSIRRNPSVSAN